MPPSSTPRRRWSADIEGPTDELGAEFTYHFKDIHRATFRIVEFVPNEKVVWLCVANYFDFTQDTTEWTGTKVVFEVGAVDGKTQVDFAHVGLVPDYECFEVCVNAWTGYVSESLKTLVVTGTGNPNNEARNATALAQRSWREA